MMGKQHLLAGALAGAVVTSTSTDSRVLVLFGAAIGAASSHGALSPDVDQTGPWRALPNVGGLTSHRYGLSHWWGLPALAWWGITNLPVQAHWVAYALLAGWVSHLLGDLVFGKLALFPWGGPKFGLGLRTDGMIEKGPARVALIVALGWVLWATPSAPSVDLPSMPFASMPAAAGGDYDRAAFGTPWADVDRNGCSTRDDILTRDLTDRTYRDKCVVLTGVLEHDLYTGQRIEWTKAKATVVQIDHVVSLADAWRSGADRWTPEQRKTYANDRYNLVAVDGRTNASKSDQGPDTWLPANKDAACRYTARYALVKAKYGLTSTAAQTEAIGHTLAACTNGEAP